LFDDCLSAVDAHVGRHIFDHVLSKTGLLCKKARILVTHGIQYLPDTDRVLMLINGKMGEYGPYKTLMENNGLLQNLIQEFGTNTEETDDVIDVEKLEHPELVELVICKEPTPQQQPEGTIMSTEVSAKGKVEWSVYSEYARACSYQLVVTFVIIAIVAQFVAVSQNVLLSFWADYNDKNKAMMLLYEQNPAFQWLLAYGALGLTYSILVVFQVLFAWVFCGIRAASLLHIKLLENVLRLPMSFFDTTPLGRIMNRFSKDQYTIDEVLPRSFLQYFRTLFSVCSVLAVNMFGNPYYILLTVPMGVLYNHFQKYYLATSRELKRLDSVSRSPIYSNFQESLAGTNTIRAFQQQNRFITLNEERVDYNQKAYYPSVSSNRWLAVRLEFIGALIVFGSASFGVVSLYFGAANSSVIGLMLVYSLSVTQTLNWMVRQSCEIETNIVSVERIKEYSEIETEAPAEIPETFPGINWPSQGAISFINYGARYRQGLELVVKDLNFDIKPREKIGIVGRTGAGTVILK
jgi:ABC-type multidrug transport system fused ATPase/permease subunit